MSSKGDILRKEGVRLTEPLDQELADRLWPGPDIALKEIQEACQMFDIAHTVMLAEQGIITKSEASKILAGLKKLESEGIVKTRMATRAGYHSGETYLTKTIDPEVAGKMHTGRSSGDLGAVSYRITLRLKLLEVMKHINELRRALLKQAEENIETVMPGYTYIQHAQPITFALYCHSWVAMLERDFQRLLGAYRHTNISPAGAAIMTGSQFPVDRKRTAELLGFDDLYTNTRDAIFGTDYLLETFASLAIMMNTLARLSEDIEVMCTHEFNMVELADRYCITSSIMPQKKNPWSTEYIRFIAGAIFGRATSTFFYEKSPLSVPSEMTSWELWKTIDESLSALRLTKGTIETLKVNRDVMKRLAGEFWAQATDIAGLLVTEGQMSWRSSHHLVGILVRKAIEQGKGPSEVTSKMIDEIAEEHVGRPLHISEKSIKNVMDPLECVKARKTIGGPQPQEMKIRVDESSKRIIADDKTVIELRTRLNEAKRKLDEAVSETIKA